MIQECLDIFNKTLDEKGDSFLFDNYIAKLGTYVLVTMKNNNAWSYEVVELTYDKKDKLRICSNELRKSLINFVDYNSELVDMNKPIDPKKIIHSNNIYSFFVKKESIKDKKLTPNIITNYYDILENPANTKYKSNKKSKELFNKIDEQIEQNHKEIYEYSKNNIDSIKSWILNNIFTLENVDYSRKDYLKIFFIQEDDDKTRKIFELEGKKYFLPNIYNKNDFNVSINKNIYGLSNYNMGMNSKKPYLEHKTRKTKVPYLTLEEDIMVQKKFFDYLLALSKDSKNLVFFDMGKDVDEEGIESYKNGEMPIFNKESEKLKSNISGYLLSIRQGKSEAEIINFNTISNFKTYLDPSIKFKECVEFSKGEKNTSLDKDNKRIYIDNPDNLYNKTIKNKEELFNIFNEVLYSNYLRFNMFSDASQITVKDTALKKFIIDAKDMVFNFIYTNRENFNKLYFINHIRNIIKHSIKNGAFKRACMQLNIMISMMDYMEGDLKMANSVEEIKDTFKTNLLEKKGDWNFASDEEYFFGVGQAVSYLESKRNTKKKDMSYINTLLDTSNDENIKNKIRQKYRKVSSNINQNEVRINNLVANILSYKPQKKVNSDYIMIGILNKNMLYTKKEQTSDNSDNMENI